MIWPRADCKATGNHMAGTHSHKLKFDLLSTSTRALNSFWTNPNLWLNGSQTLIRCLLLFCFIGLLELAQAPLPTLSKRHQQKQRGDCATVIHVIANPGERRLRRPLSRLQATWRPDSFQSSVPEGEKLSFVVVICCCRWELQCCAALERLLFYALRHPVVTSGERLCLPVKKSVMEFIHLHLYLSSKTLTEDKCWGYSWYLFFRLRRGTFSVQGLCTQVRTGGEDEDVEQVVKKMNTKIWVRWRKRLNHLYTPGLLCWLNNWGTDGWISEEGCWEQFCREPRSSIPADDQILFEQKLTSGLVWNSLEGFFHPGISLFVRSSCVIKSVPMKDLLRLHLKGKSNLKIQVFCYFVFGCFFYVLGNWELFSSGFFGNASSPRATTWLLLPSNCLRNAHVSLQTYY